jgi:hypothetical protein
MKNRFNSIIKAISIGFALAFMATTLQAAKPVWEYTPDGPVHIMVDKGTPGEVRYQVHNNSSKPKNLRLKTPVPQGMSQQGSCVMPGHGNCTLVLKFNGAAMQGNIIGGPILCQKGNANQCYQPNPQDRLQVRLPPGPVLSSSTGELVLSVNDVATNSALTGNKRSVTITNNGSLAATGVQVVGLDFPNNTSQSNNCPATLAAGASCEVTVTPGNTASSDNTSMACTAGTEPVAGKVSVTANNVALPTVVNVLVLGFGCIYQSGYIFDIDDTTSNTGSIGGKVAATTDLPDPVRWGPLGLVSGIDENSTADSDSCDGKNDGQCNTTRITAASLGSDVAAQYCKVLPDGGFSDWYLPAICELGPSGGGGAHCDTVPNVYDNLKVAGLGGFVDEIYWSSTEFSGNPTDFAWVQFFKDGGQFNVRKTLSFFVLVRCVRALIP